jgi:hypothetical protein
VGQGAGTKTDAATLEIAVARLVAEQDALNRKMAELETVKVELTTDRALLQSDREALCAVARASQRESGTKTSTDAEFQMVLRKCEVWSPAHRSRGEKIEKIDNDRIEFVDPNKERVPQPPIIAPPKPTMNEDETTSKPKDHK